MQTSTRSALASFSSDCRCQFQYVVRRAQQAPLPADFDNPAEQELAETSGTFDVSKNRFNRLSPQIIAAAMACFAQALAHLLDPATHIVWFLIIRRHIATYASSSERFQIQSGAVTRICGNLSRLPSYVFTNLIQQRNHLMSVASVIGHQLRHDDLSVGIHSRLRILALDETIRRPHDPAFRIREVSLRFLFGNAGRFRFMPRLVRVRSGSGSLSRFCF